MADQQELALLAEKLEQTALDKSVTDAQFYELQKTVFKNALEALKAKADDGTAAEANYLIGLIGLTDGDRFRVPPQNVISHLQTAYQGGHAGAGIQLYRAHKGAYPYIPEQMRSLAKGVLILEKLAKGKYAHASYELAQHYLDMIDGYIQNEDEAPEDHYHQAYAYAQDAMQMNYCGGYLLLGIMSFHGFLGLIALHKPTAYEFFVRGLEVSGNSFLEFNLVGQLHHWIGYCLFSGDGTGMNRVEGISHYRQASVMNCGEAVQWLEDNKDFIAQVETDQDQGNEFYYDLEAEPEPEAEPAPAKAAEQKDPAKVQNPFEKFADTSISPARPIIKKTTTH